MSDNMIVDDSVRGVPPSSVERALFVPAERWGWQYVDPGPPALSKLRERPPVYVEPSPPDTRRWQATVDKAQRSMTKRVIWTVVLFFVLAPFGKGFGFVLWLAVAAAAFGPMLLAKRNISAALQAYQEERERRQRDHRAEEQRWKDAISAEEGPECQRVNTCDLWFPLRLEQKVDRIDVFGGVPHGWPHLLATFASTVLAEHGSVLVLDFTEHDVAAGLMELARGVTSVTGMQLPRDSDRLDLLDGLDAEEAAEVLADALETLRPATDPNLRALDADVLLAVGQCLDGGLSPRRLAAGVRVLQRAYEDDGCLSLEEVTRLTRHVDLAGGTERAQDELRFLRTALDLLRSRVDSGANIRLPLLTAKPGLTVVATSDGNHRRKDFVDRVLFHAVLQRLGSGASTVAGQVLVVAGADHLGSTSLESMARQALRRGVRLVYLFEHLRDETRRLIGSSQSATLIMRLGNAEEAAAAAEFIGRGYSMKLSQVTKQVGITSTYGGGTSTGFSTTITEGNTRGGGSGGSSFSNSYSESISRSTQEMTNWSKADSTTDGTVHARSYEFSVEPTTIQSLPATAFILIEGGSGGRRTVIGDCNPAIALLSRVASDRQSVAA
ncbi:hypothetical protein [Modestobacter marinus]|uniref:hypothetical protein n=1 Tax=Modestobacter marinus TaxID=477641 RepID=UPI001C93D92D|nr:hypothetical protein [Modestobacter marinus]